MDRYSYLIDRYSKKTRYHVFWMTSAMVVLLIGSAIAIEIGETDVQRRDRIHREQTLVVRVACKLGPRVCELAQEDARKVNCRLFREDCKLNE
jgi:hypothetical protein